MMLRTYIEQKKNPSGRSLVQKRIEEELELVAQYGLEGEFVALADLFDHGVPKGMPHWIGARGGNSYLLYLLGVTQCNPMEFGLDCHVFFDLGDEYWHKRHDITVRAPLCYTEGMISFLKTHPSMEGKAVQDYGTSYSIGGISIARAGGDSDLPDVTVKSWNPDTVLDKQALAKFIVEDYQNEQYHQLLERCYPDKATITFDQCLQVFGLMCGTWQYENHVDVFLQMNMNRQDIPVFLDDKRNPQTLLGELWLENSQYLFPKMHCIEYLVCEYRVAQS